MRMGLAHKAANPAIPILEIAASQPPANITSASLYWIERNASPIECVPVALENKVGIDTITRFDTTDYKAKLAAEVKNFELSSRWFGESNHSCFCCTIISLSCISYDTTDRRYIDNPSTSLF